MGYRSDVVLLLYGTPAKVDMVDTLLLQKLDPEYDREMFESCKQVVDTDGERMIMWGFRNVKWYDKADYYKECLFDWVQEINDAAPDHEKDFKLALDFARAGENFDDNEEQQSDDTEYRAYIVRSIEVPDEFQLK